MTLEATIKTGATAIVPTAGTDLVFDSLHTGVAGKNTVRFVGDTDFTTRRTVDFSVKDPTVQISAPGGYTQLREKAFIKWPMTLANGARTVNTLEISLSCDSEMDQADKLDMRYIGAQILGDASFDAFFDSHDLS